MNRIIIAGSRTFTDYELLCTKMDRICSNLGDEVEVVSGGARGADLLGEKWAKGRGHPVKLFPAEWDRFGHSAGYQRNKLMAAYATHLVAFWDGKSRGTQHMIECAIHHHLGIRVVRFDKIGR